MRIPGPLKIFLASALTSGAMLAPMALAQSPSAGPYELLQRVKVGGDGGSDYVEADVQGRRLYVCRMGPMGRIMVFNLDTLAPVGEVPNAAGHGAVADPKVHHGFTTSKPIVMFDSNTLAKIKTIEVQGSPDGILFDPYNERVYDLSHAEPNITVIDAKEGTVVGTIDLGGAPEQAATDGKGHIFIDVEDKGRIDAIDAKTMKVTRSLDISGTATTCAGLAWDIKNHVLFATCRMPNLMVILNSETGKILTTIPIGQTSDGALFNPKTMEAFSSNVDGTLTVVKEKSPTSFELEQTVKTMPTARTSALDTKTGRIFLIAAEFGPPPANLPPDATPIQRRGPMVPGSFSVLVVGKPPRS